MTEKIDVIVLSVLAWLWRREREGEGGWSSVCALRLLSHRERASERPNVCVRIIIGRSGDCLSERLLLGGDEQCMQSDLRATMDDDGDGE